MNSNWSVGHIEQLQQSVTDRFIDFDKNKSLFTTFTDPLESSYEGSETALQLKLITVYSSDELRFKLKVRCLIFINAFLKIQIIGRKQLFVQVCSDALPLVNNISH
jgi:hypothetical protein